MIVLFTDFGLDGPYTGQVKTVLYRTAPGVPVVDLFADAPGRTGTASGLAGRLARDRLYRPVRQRDDRTASGGAAPWNAPIRVGTRSGTRSDIFRCPGGRRLLVRELERARRDCRQCRP